MNIVPNDVEANYKKALNFLKDIGDKECDFVVFPEDFLTGAILNEIDFEKFEEPIPGKYTDMFTGQAEEYGVHIVMGSAIEKVDGGRYNTSVLIDDKGNIIGKYRKNMLWASENKHINYSKEQPVFDTKYGKVAMNICWDLAFPHIAHNMARKGAKILFAPAFWSREDKYGMVKEREIINKLKDVDSEPVFVDTIAAARAFENEMAVVYVNPYGDYQLGEYTLHMFGHTQINMPFYGNVAMMEDKEGVLIKDIDLDMLDIAEKVYEINKKYDITKSP